MNHYSKISETREPQNALWREKFKLNFASWDVQVYQLGLWPYDRQSGKKRDSIFANMI